MSNLSSILVSLVSKSVFVWLFFWGGGEWVLVRFRLLWAGTSEIKFSGHEAGCCTRATRGVLFFCRFLGDRFVGAF